MRWSPLVVLAACSGGITQLEVPHDEPMAIQARLGGTLDDLAAFGEKRAGTAAGRQAGDYVAERLRSAGFQPVFEEFSFLSFAVASSQVTAGGVAYAHQVFAYSGVGRVEADIVWVGDGHPDDYQGKDVTGRIVMVRRDPTFHRSSQYREIVQRGGAAMLYLSTAPDNLVQVGTVADPEDGLGPIPAVSIGAVDGDALVAAGPLTGVVDVQASVTPATARNVVARLPGDQPGYLLVGAHYDTWFTGSSDNGGGVALLLEVAEALRGRGGGRLGLVFVAYDGEELGLFGGYDYLRRHVVAGEEPMLGFVNFEVPANEAAGLRALAYTNGGPVDPTLRAAGLPALFPIYVPMQVVPSYFGGIIPTDIQGMYWYGLQGLSTACDTPWYHTAADTPDKVDLGHLTDSAIRFVDFLGRLDSAAVTALQARDPEVWRIAVTSTRLVDLQVEVTVTDAAGVARADAPVTVWLDVDDFRRVHRIDVRTDASGHATATIPAARLAEGTGRRWLHVTSGPSYPLGEAIVSIE